MVALTMAQKAALAGVGVLAVGVGAGYWVGTERGNGEQVRPGQDAMVRDEADFGAGYGRGGNRDQGASLSAQGTRRAVSVPSDQGRMSKNVDRGNCIADECLLVDGLEYPVGTLPESAKSAVLSALDDEYKARATYEAVMSKLGRIRPFVMISRAETQHISSLAAILDKYGIDTPADPWIGKVSVPDTLAESCQAGVAAEIANASLYRDDLLPKVKEYEDIVGVFTSLMDASQEQHLSAFQSCD